MAAYPLKSEEENFDPTQAPRRQHRSKPKRRDEEYSEEPIPTNNQGGYYEDSANSPEPSYENEMVNRKPRKERKKKNRDTTDDGHDDPYLNINVQSPNGHNQNYPFEDASESVQLEDDSQYQDDEVVNSDDGSHRNDAPPEPKPKKKSGGFMKIFASFKKKNKTKNPDNGKLNGKQWQSNPEIFNPAYDSQPGSLERSSSRSIFLVFYFSYFVFHDFHFCPRLISCLSFLVLLFFISCLVS